MASEKMKDFKEMSMDELKENLTQMETEYIDTEFDHVSMGLENPLILRQMRRDIARVKTLIRQQELTEMSPELLAKRSKIVHRRRKR